MQRCGLYVYGGIDENNYVSDKLFQISIEGKKMKWSQVSTLGTRPPPLFSHSMSYLKDRNFTQFVA